MQVGIYRIYQSGYVFDFYQWSFQFRLFCDYLSKFIIPIYEWCFTDMLLEVIESKNEFIGNEIDAHRNHLLKAKELLETFIDKNHKLFTESFIPTHETEIRNDMIDTFAAFERDPEINSNIYS